ncbi:MAG: glycosyltransferase family A protein [Bacteroidota bacterium]
MSFASGYLSHQNVNNGRIKNPVDENTGLIIVIPCYNEKEIINAIDSLNNCNNVSCVVELIIVINSPENSEEAILLQNQQSITEIEEWKSSHPDSQIRIEVVHISDVPKKHAGVGLARKIGMDEAVLRFNSINKPDGVIVCFDADCKCESNYLVEIEKEVCKKPAVNLFVSNFEHPLTGDEYSDEIYHAVLQYELHLRYFVNALRYSGFPYSYHTIGSCMGIKASLYAMQGGMNKRQAGEDFYFLHKLFHIGGVVVLNNTCVYPSSRPSNRVPFGTGKAIKKMLENKEDVYFTYSFSAFSDLKSFFSIVPDFYNRPNEFDLTVSEIPESLRVFFDKFQLYEIINESIKNSASLRIFIKRFYNRFNAFQVIKFLNYSHTNIYRMKPVVEQANIYLAELYKNNCSYGDKELIEIFRKVDTGKYY